MQSPHAQSRDSTSTQNKAYRKKQEYIHTFSLLFYFHSKIPFHFIISFCKMLVNSLVKKRRCNSHFLRMHPLLSTLQILCRLFLQIIFKILSELFDYFQPSFRSFNTSHLDTCQCIIQFLSDWSHLLHSTWETDFFSVINNFTYR